MKRILILSFSPVRGDPRVTRQIRALEDRYDLTVAGAGDSPGGRLSFVPLRSGRSTSGIRLLRAAKLLLRFHETYYWNIPQVSAALNALSGQRFDLVIANDIITLPLALKLARGSPVLIDAHEFAPKEFEDRLYWRLLFAPFYAYLCGKYLPFCASMLTVSMGIADAYRQYGATPIVSMNCPPYRELSCRPVNPKRIRLVHHGICTRSRKIELMIEMMQSLDSRYTLDLLLVDRDPECMTRLRKLAAGDPRITFRAPVPMEEIPQAINEYDVGVYILPPNNFNAQMALPNKFFEFVQARLAVAIGPSPEMKALAESHDFGIISPSWQPEDLAEKIRSLSHEAIYSLKVNADRASRCLSASEASRPLVAEVERLIG